MDLVFKATDGKKVVLRGMSNDAPRIVSTKQMEGIFRHGDVTYATKCLIMTEKPSNNNHQYHIDIHTLFSKHDRVFGQIPPGRLLSPILGITKEIMSRGPQVLDMEC
jgi:hypothetical protein